MCGRFSVNKTDQELEAFVGAPLPKDFARKEVFPTQPVLAVTPDGVTTLNWGLRVEWQKSPIINARAETISQKKTFAHAFRHNRCLVPADGYWEWSPDKKRHYFQFDDNRLFWLGGIYYPEENGTKLVLITTEPNSVAKTIHDRMPVIIEPENKNQWLNASNISELSTMLQTHELNQLVVDSQMPIQSHII